MTRPLSRTLLLLLIVQSATGLLWPALYRDSGWIRASWFGNDLVTLLVAAPVLMAGVRLEHRDPDRGGLLVMGIAAYATYNSAFYALGAALNAAFPIYVATLLVAPIALVSTWRGVDAAAIVARVKSDTPVRAIGGSLCVIACGLAGVWLAMWTRYIRGWQDLPVPPGDFRLVATLDLTLMAPALAASGVLLWLRHPLGFIGASAACLQAGLYLLVLSVNSILAIVTNPSTAPGEFPIWGALAATMGALTWRLMAHLSPAPPQKATS